MKDKMDRLRDEVPGMRQAVYGDDAVLIAWAQKRIGVEFRDDATAIGLVRSDDVGPVGADRDTHGRLILASVVFDSFSKFDCSMHVASDGSGRWLTRDFMVRCFAYPFIQLGLRRVTGLVPADNEAALRFDLHLGFKEEGRCRDAAENGDLIILGMTRADCRYLPQETRHA
jgi:RimJ/RimL family protein N-acetyltransferase